MKRLKERFESNFRKAVTKDSIDSLGDRSKYIGASDIAGCPRKAYLSKKQKVDHSFEQLLTFQRGHQFECIVEKMLYGETYKNQVEVKWSAENGFPIAAHLDFVLFDKTKKTATVIEAKSTRGSVEFYDSYLLQVQLQMGLLQKQCGSAWKIDGAVVVVSTNDNWDILPLEQNKAIFDLSMSKANVLANAIESGICPDGEEQLYCSSCPFKSDCSTITKGASENLPEEIVKVVNKIKSLSTIEKEISSLKTQLKDFFEATGKKRVKSDDCTVSYVSVKGKDGVDVERLKSEYPDVYTDCQKMSGGYSFMKIV